MRVAAASGRRSEMSEGPRSKFQAFAVRQRGNFGRRNRASAPMEGLQEVWLDVAYRIHIHYAYTPTKSSQSLPPAGGKKFKSLFTATCVWGKNTSQTANMEFCRLQQNYACSRPQIPLAENSEEFLPVKKETPEGVSFCCKYVDRLYLICQPGPCWPQPFPGRYRRASWTPQP